MPLLYAFGHNPRGHGPMHMRGHGHGHGHSSERGHGHGHEHGPARGQGDMHMRGHGHGGRGFGHCGRGFGFGHGGLGLGPRHEFPLWALMREERRGCSDTGKKSQKGPKGHCHKKLDKKEKKEFLKAVIANAFLPNFFDDVDTPRVPSTEAAKPKNAFEVKVDVTNFSPQELDVKTVDRSIVVEGKHREKQDELGFISRSFTRRYELPDGVEPESVLCKMSSDGFLVISAPAIVETPVTNERNIPITLTTQTANDFFVAASAPTDQVMDSTEDKDSAETARSVPIASDDVSKLD